MGPQLWHQGMSRKPGTGHFPEAPSDGPSGITLLGKKVGEAPSESEVLDMAQAYADAACDAKQLGFDCVELHGAHSYLIDESPSSRQTSELFSDADYAALQVHLAANPDIYRKGIEDGLTPEREGRVRK